ncbi:iron ABC transporter [Virgibacillus dokdonensis]|uniref:Iron ABC transporter n=1 Tax=Virgibacillus dokdonensis TaxID=302167 RepID=A0A3E0WJW3_9BACI|nr:iron ABC transporter permease [Virgibacillus dokdonensis]RFA33048.1 iron ABC transporter [Virgibacillus dokdonensis]
MKKVKREIQHTAFPIKLIIAIIVCFFTFLIATKMGAKETSFADVFNAFFQKGSSPGYSIIRDIRLPREVAVMFVGAALAVSGAIMQGMTRNPLADPGLLGLTSGANAALACALAMLPSVSTFGIMVACFIGAAAGAGLVFGIGSMQKGGFTPVKLVLAGAAISIFLQAVADAIGLYFKISKNISLWTAGGAIGTTWQQLSIVVPFILIGLLFALLLSRQVTILSLKEDVATGLGQNTRRIRWLLFIVIVILAGAAVSLVGNMAFIGLMIPHIVRAIVGVDYRHIIPMSIFTGAIFMLLADLVGRMIHAPMETPVVSIVAVLGLPFFLFVVRKGGSAFQ